MDKTTCYFLGFCAVCVLFLLVYIIYTTISIVDFWVILVILFAIAGSYFFGRLIDKWING